MPTIPVLLFIQAQIGTHLFRNLNFDPEILRRHPNQKTNAFHISLRYNGYRASGFRFGFTKGRLNRFEKSGVYVLASCDHTEIFSESSSKTKVQWLSS